MSQAKDVIMIAILLLIFGSQGYNRMNQQEIIEQNESITIKLDSILSFQDELFIADSMHIDGVRKHYRNCSYTLRKDLKYYGE